MSSLPLDLAMLADHGLPVENLDAGEKVFLVNEEGDCLYVVVSGSVEIITVGHQVEVVGPGGIFGEIALVDQGRRTASALAATDAEVYRISRDAFLELVRQHPTFALNVLAALAERLRRKPLVPPKD